MTSNLNRAAFSHWLWHPFLFAIYPILSLAAANLAWVRVSEIWRAIFGVLFLTAVLTLFLRVVLRSWPKAALLVSLYSILFFGFGHIVSAAFDIFSLHPFIAKRLLTALYAALFILVTWFVARIVKRDLSGLTFYLNIVAAVALILPVFNLALHTAQNLNNSPKLPTELPQSTNSSNVTQPDIYYIILDEYTRADIFRELHDLDSTSFLKFLTDTGFYVADQSYSNYAQTTFSLASSLNMEYVNEMGNVAGIESDDRSLMTPLIHNNKVRAFLANQGYQFIAITSGWDQSEIREADQYIWSGSVALNEFESKLIENTLPGSLFLNDFQDEAKRRKVNYIFDALENLPGELGPKFVFAHFFSPHSPLVFDSEGNDHTPNQFYRTQGILADGLDGNVYSQEYREETQYLNKRLEETITRILADSARPPVIIIQGDHGSRLYLDWDSAENTCIHERMAILNAYYLPGVDPEELYPGISPVNSFRVVLNEYFNTGLDLLEEDHYFMLWDRPYDFINVNDRLEESCHP